jgi:hypothetical protein
MRWGNVGDGGLGYRGGVLHLVGLALEPLGGPCGDPHGRTADGT